MNVPQLITMGAAAIVLSLLLLGIGLLWFGNALALVGGESRRVQHRVLNAVGWSSLALGTLGLLVGLLSFLALPLLVVLAIMLAIAMSWFRRSEADALLWSLGQALRHGVGLEESVRALAEERHDRLGRRALHLADRLAAGVPPPLALQAFIPSSDLDARVMVELSSLMNRLPEDVLAHDEVSEDLKRTLLKIHEGIFYLIALTALEMGIFLYFMVNIAPQLRSVFNEFNLPQPAFFEFWSQLGLWGLGIEHLALAAAAVLWALLGLTAFSFLQSHLTYVDVPILARFGKPLDRSRILTALALGLRYEMPLDTICEFLAKVYPKQYLRPRLTRVAAEVRQGQDPWDSLRKQGLLSQGDVGLLRSGQRVGNLSWSLREQAHVIRRRYANRQQVLVQLLMPIAVLAIAAAILMLGSGVYIALADVAEALS